MSSSTKTKSCTKERYLKIPNHILNLRGVSLAEKVLLAHFYSFGAKGCWQSNATLAEMFMTSPSSISRSIAALKKAGLIAIRAPKGWHRTIWARSHPQVPAAQPPHLRKTLQEVRQKGTSELVKSAIRVTQKCTTTNNNTIIDNNKDTTTTPSPLPAGGQAPALLADRRAQALERIAAFTKGFGRTPHQRMTPQEFEQRRRQMIKALRSM
jgi:Mn-dependent DtxR family transcriptional regulator